MVRIAKSLTELIGGAPLVRLAGYGRKHGLQQDIVARLESLNPTGNARSRMGPAVIEDAGARGVLRPGTTVTEPTSSSTRVELAMVATIKGYHLMLTIPETMNIERRNLLKTLGAEVMPTDDMMGMAGPITKTKELRNRIPGVVILQQLEGPSNTKVHELTTGEEIWRGTDGQADVFVAGVGTDGTACSTTRALRKHSSDIHIVAVKLVSSPVLEGGRTAPHRIQDMGANFVLTLYDTLVTGEVILVPDDEVIRVECELASTKGPLAGISFGAAVYTACLLARHPKFTSKMVVTLLSDMGERYLSTELFTFDTYPSE